MQKSISRLRGLAKKSYSSFSLTLLLLYLLSFQTAYAQNGLFVHFDKNVYSNNETVYFTGYLVKEGKVPLSSHQIMAVALISNVDSALVTEDKFLINKEGVAYGSLTLPDSIATGDYRFVVYTDKLVDGIPDMQFIQNITIKSGITPPFKAQATLMEQVGNEQKVLVTATTSDGRPLAKPAKILYRYGRIRKNTITDGSGQSIISLSLQPEVADNNLYINLIYATDSLLLIIDIPPTKPKAFVTFYPEGGTMVSGLTSRIGWEVKDHQRRPVALKAFLYQDQQIIDTLETSNNGIGSFLLHPQNNAIYSVKLVHSAFKDSSYNLPAAHSKGMVMRLLSGLSSDTLNIIISSTEAVKYTLLVHNLKTNFNTYSLEMGKGEKMLRLPINALSKGLTTLTLMDSLKTPLAERIFFAHYNSSEKINLTTDQTVYKPREKVTLKVSLNTAEAAMVSIAVVQNNRLEAKKMNDIESYTYLNSELKNLPIALSGRGYKDELYLEQVLLVKGWRKYTMKPGQVVSVIDSLQVLGQVGRLIKRSGKPFLIGSMGGRTPSLTTTSSEGSFHLTREQLLTPAGGKLHVFVDGHKHKAIIYDQYSVFNHQFVRRQYSDQPPLPSALVNNNELILKNDEKIPQLEEVIITAKKDNSFHYTPRNRLRNVYKDYVCINGILNCPYHKTGFPPVQGEEYPLFSLSGKRVIYTHPTIPDQSIFTPVNGVHLQKEFYETDFTDPNEPAFFSTIYWNYGVVLNTIQKEVKLSFYTGDIKGKFRVVVQGITNNDVVYAEQFFEVREP